MSKPSTLSRLGPFDYHVYYITLTFEAANRRTEPEPRVRVEADCSRT
jgi:hypothetical protein